MKSADRHSELNTNVKHLVPVAPQLLKVVKKKAAVSLDVMPYVPPGRRHVVTN